MRGLKLRCITIGTDLIVASFTDAWIETVKDRQDNAGKESHLLQMRGLKQCTYGIYQNWRWSHLLQMRGLKLLQLIRNQCHNKSHLLQMRGLKRCSEVNTPPKGRSHLLQMRGLKRLG